MRIAASLVFVAVTLGGVASSLTACDLEIRCYTDDNCPYDHHCAEGLCVEGVAPGSGGASAGGGGVGAAAGSGGGASCVDEDCALGTYCGPDQTCLPCNDAAHCGQTCAACEGMTPVCDGTACVGCLPDGTGCEAAEYCDPAQTCQPCDTNERCGAECEPCADPTPFCNGGSCVECLGHGDCASPTPCCVANICVIGLC